MLLFGESRALNFWRLISKLRVNDEAGRRVLMNRHQESINMLETHPLNG